MFCLWSGRATYQVLSLISSLICSGYLPLSSSTFPTRLQPPTAESLSCAHATPNSVSNTAWGEGGKQAKGHSRLCLRGEALTKGCERKWEGSSQEALPFWVLTAASWILPWEKLHGARWDMAGWVSESLFGLCANGIKEMPETLMKTRLPSQEGKRWPWTKSLRWLIVYVNCSMPQSTQIAFWVFIGRCSWMRWTYKSVNCSKQLALADRNGPLGTLCKVHHTLPVPNMSPESSILIYIPALVGKPHYGIWNWTLNSYGWLYHLTFSLCPINNMLRTVSTVDVYCLTTSTSSILLCINDFRGVHCYAAVYY